MCVNAYSIYYAYYILQYYITFMNNTITLYEFGFFCLDSALGDIQYYSKLYILYT
jgi:hypothetical protein